MTRKDLNFKRKYRDELRRAIMSLVSDPTASESISTPNGGSRSVSYQSLSSLQAELRKVEEEIAIAERAMTRGGIGIGYVRWC